MDPSFVPFILKGLVSLTGKVEDRRGIILRDTGASQSLLLMDALPLSVQSYCGSQVLLKGIEMGCALVPLHNVHVTSELVSGVFTQGIQPKLPVKGIDFLLGNDIAGGRVLPVLEVLDFPDSSLSDELAGEFPETFPACVVTRAQSCRLGDVCDLSESVLGPAFATDSDPGPTIQLPPPGKKSVKESPLNFVFDSLPLSVSREWLISCQTSNPTLVNHFALATAPVATP